MKMIENDLTQGSVFRKLWAFTLPFIGANLLQTLYNMVDLYIVGRYAATADISAVSVAGTITTTFLMLLVGLSVGATVIVGQRYGAGDRNSLCSVVSTAFTITWITDAVLMILLALLAVPALGWINTPEEAMPGAVRYLLICSIGFVFQAVYNMLSGILRGMGDSRSPLLFVGVSTVFNIFGDILLVGVFHMGAAGAAAATVCAQFLCMVYSIRHVRQRDFPFDFKHISLDRLFLFATIPTYAFNASISAMAAQNIGAGERKRAVSCLWYGVLLSGMFAIVFFMLGWLIPEKIVGIFSEDPAVITNGVLYYTGYKFEYPLCSLAFCVNGFINGTGHTRLTLINNVVSAYLVRIPACLIAANFFHFGLLAVGFALPMASLMQVIVGFAFFFSGRWKKKLL